MEIRVVVVPEPVVGSEHGFKYALFYGRKGRRAILYDNERPKGDHRHLGDHQGHSKNAACHEGDGVGAILAEVLAGFGD